MTEIIAGLWIGSWTDAQQAKPGTITVTVATDAKFVGQRKFDLVDGPGNTQAVFNAAVEAVVYYAKGWSQPLLVHCVSGRSRSAAVVVAALTRLNSCSVSEAYDLVVRKHERTRIHPHLSKLVLRYANEEN